MGSTLQLHSHSTPEVLYGVSKLARYLRSMTRPSFCDRFDSSSSSNSHSHSAFTKWRGAAPESHLGKWRFRLGFMARPVHRPCLWDFAHPFRERASKSLRRTSTVRAESVADSRQKSITSTHLAPKAECFLQYLRISRYSTEQNTPAPRDLEARGKVLAVRLLQHVSCLGSNVLIP